MIKIANLLEVNNVSASYGVLKILKGVSLNVEKSEIVVVIGPNAAGKTTLLRTIMGILHPVDGKITFKNQIINGLQTHEIVKLGISLIPEGRHLFNQLDVEDNLDLGAYTPRARKRMKETKEWIYSLFPRLKERRNQLAGTLSGGEQQMLAIGRGLMNCPEVLLIDEPSAGLAPILLPVVFSAIKEINKSGIAVLLVEQNVLQSLQLAERAYLLENGQITLSGNASSLLEDENVKKAYLGI